MTADPPDGTPVDTIVLFPQRGCRRGVSGHRLRTQWRAELACQDGRLGDGGRAVTALRILVREAPTAWAAYEGPVQ